MSAGFFKMYENLSAVMGACSGDLRNQSLNQLIRSSNKVGCVKTYIMLEAIELCRRISVREVGKRFQFHEVDEDSADVDDDTNIESDLLKGIKDRRKVNVMKSWVQLFILCSRTSSKCLLVVSVPNLSMTPGEMNY